MGNNSKSNSQNKLNSVMHRIINVRELTISVILVGFCVFLSIASPNFLTPSNIRVIFTSLSYEMGICAFMAVSLIGGNIDFSIGSVLGIGGFLCSMMLLSGMNMWLAILLTIIVGLILGGINGILVGKLHIIPMVATMGTWMAYKGLGLVMIKNQSISNLPDEIKVFGQEWSLFGIPFSVILMIILCVIAWFLLKYVPFFHQAYYVGENSASAKLAGINTSRFTTVCYAITGGVAALTGIMSISRFGSAPSTLGQGLEMKMVTALLIGGVSFSGGEGSIIGAFLGALMMQVITNALAMFNIESNVQNIVIGVILVIAVALDEYNQKRRRGI